MTFHDLPRPSTGFQGSAGFPYRFLWGSLKFSSKERWERGGWRVVLLDLWVTFLCSLISYLPSGSLSAGYFLIRKVVFSHAPDSSVFCFNYLQIKVHAISTCDSTSVLCPHFFFLFYFSQVKLPIIISIPFPPLWSRFRKRKRQLIGPYMWPGYGDLLDATYNSFHWSTCSSVSTDSATIRTCSSQTISTIWIANSHWSRHLRNWPICEIAISSSRVIRLASDIQIGSIALGDGSTSHRPPTLHL